MTIEDIYSKFEEIYNDFDIDLYLAVSGSFFEDLLNYPAYLFSICDLIGTANKLKQSAIKKFPYNKKTILDSGFGNLEITNKMILECAEKLRPTYVVPKDYVGNNVTTIKSIYEFLQIKDSYNLKSDILVPIQDPWKIDQGFMKFDYFAIGGIVKMHGHALNKVIEQTTIRYPNKKFHIFGKRLKPLTKVLKKHRNIISLDTAIEIRAVMDSYERFDACTGKYGSYKAMFYNVFFLLEDIVYYINERDKNEGSKQATLFDYE